MRWIDGNRAVLSSLRRLFTLKAFKVHKGRTWCIPCAPGTLADGKPALEPCCKAGQVEPVEAPASQPAAAGEAAASKE